jgi:predicted nucleotidyltransferase
MEKKYSNSVRIRYPPSEKRLINLLKQNANKLINKVSTIQRIIIFGSYARQKPHFGSDVDLLFIVSKHTPKEFEKIYETLYDISKEYEWAPLIISEKKFEKLKSERNQFFKKVEKDKITIWHKN